MIQIVDKALLQEKLTEKYILQSSLDIWKFSVETGLPKEQYPDLELIEDYLGIDILPYTCLFCLDANLRSSYLVDSDLVCESCLVKYKIPSFKEGLVVESCTSLYSAVTAYDNSVTTEKIRKYASIVVSTLEKLLKEYNGRENSL